jgi:hypothetical protein
MSKEAEYRGFAASCLHVASKTPDPAHKTRLLAMAEAWLDLADRAIRMATRPAAAIADHPLVVKILRRYSGE